MVARWQVPWLTIHQPKVHYVCLSICQLAKKSTDSICVGLVMFIRVKLMRHILIMLMIEINSAQSISVSCEYTYFSIIWQIAITWICVCHRQDHLNTDWFVMIIIAMMKLLIGTFMSGSGNMFLLLLYIFFVSFMPSRVKYCFCNDDYDAQADES